MYGGAASRDPSTCANGSSTVELLRQLSNCHQMATDKPQKPKGGGKKQSKSPMRAALSVAVLIGAGALLVGHFKLKSAATQLQAVVPSDPLENLFNTAPIETDHQRRDAVVEAFKVSPVISDHNNLC